MVTLEQMRASNAKIAATLPPGLVAVFVGGTSGIGETSLKQFAKHTIKPRIYFLGRSKATGDRLSAELKELNPEGDYIFLSVDASLLSAVDDVCRQIKEKEESINLLFMTIGTLVTGKDTEEGLNYPAAVTYYARTRFVVNLLSLLKKATHLRRVVTVFAATKEGTVHTDDFQGRNIPLLSQRGHFSSMLTLSMEAIAAEKQAREVSFVHDFPGAVKSNLGKDVKSVAFTIFKAVFKVIGPLVYIPFEEAGERQLFFATSARFPPAAGDEDGSGVPLPEGTGAARGSDGKAASGVYSVNIDGETAQAKVEQTLDKLRKGGVAHKIWAHTEEEFVRITGAVSI
ncbi:hypothetical protein V8F20_010315 [Naviculisporaceae sp. PSN 640]